MKISRSHRRFALCLEDQTALEYPERFLGPNWKDVLNFWIYLDELSVDELYIMYAHYHDLRDVHTLMSLAVKAAEDTIGGVYKTAAWCATTNSIGALVIYELIGSHNLETLAFLPLFY
jgi:hypothetical protein